LVKPTNFVLIKQRKLPAPAVTCAIHAGDVVEQEGVEQVALKPAGLAQEEASTAVSALQQTQRQQQRQQQE
jgi:hypothetical protein